MPQKAKNAVPPDKLRILIPADTYYPHVNGASYFAQRLAHYLRLRGHDVLVIAPARKARHERYTHDLVDIFGVRSVPLVKGFRVAAPVLIKKKLRQVIQSFQPDVVHLQGHYHLISQTVLEIAKELRIPTVGTNHFMPENIIRYIPHLPKRINASLQHIGWRQCCRTFEEMDRVTAPTKTAANVLQEQGLTKPVVAISCGIDLKKFRPRQVSAYLRKRYRLPQKPIALFVGRIDRDKNIDLIIHAVAQAMRKSDFHLLIAGKGTQLKNLKSLAHDLGISDHVTFSGFVPDADLPALYCAVDCFVIAGTAELQSIVSMEAMASGLPVIGVRSVALPELIHDGKNGYLFPSDDISAFANALIKIMGSSARRTQMGQESLRIIQHHSIEKTISAYEQLYRELIQAGASSLHAG